MGEGKGRGRSCYCERKYEPVLRGEHDTHSAVMCARVTGWGCMRLSECVSDGKGVETEKLQNKEMEGTKNRGNNRNRQIEGRRASVADREGGWQDVNSEHIQELPRREELKRRESQI